MNSAEGPFRSFIYSLFDGPVSQRVLEEKPDKGNCRFAIQQYFKETRGIYLSHSEIVLPYARNNSRGTFIENNQVDSNEFFSGLQEGDIIYAEKLRDSHGKKIKSGKEKFETEYERLVHLHLAVYVGLPTDEILAFFSGDEIDRDKPAIWHSTFIARGTALWSVEKFRHYYKPESAMRMAI
ncbi:MAG: hypothetical protein Q8P53_00845 [Candidatus Shapirobacteria bacterium]|nr:hypothetical protein [Candidatus Shapirobacteria bacterium]